MTSLHLYAKIGYDKFSDGVDMGSSFKFAWIKTLPVMVGYLFLGIAFGLLLQKAGYNFLWALLTSICVYAGSMQFVLIGMLGNGMDLFSVALLTLTINSRHIFYGLSFLSSFKEMGKAYPYMVFSLTDETYSLLCSVQVPEQLDRKKVFFLIALLNQSYWVAGSLIGSIGGQLLTLNTSGIEFAMTAFFTVVFVEQWLAAKSHVPALAGLLSGVLAILVFGADRFILPALILAVGVLIAARPALGRKERQES
jgi:4-azaleucine resistance transporter AzlC